MKNEAFEKHGLVSNCEKYPLFWNEVENLTGMPVAFFNGRSVPRQADLSLRSKMTRVRSHGRGPLRLFYGL